jgi:hypothetical protein
MKTEQKCHYERSDSWTDLQFTEVSTILKHLCSCISVQHDSLDYSLKNITIQTVAYK